MSDFKAKMYQIQFRLSPDPAWMGCNSAQSPPHSTKCNSQQINGQCTNFDGALPLQLHAKGLRKANINFNAEI